MPLNASYGVGLPTILKQTLYTNNKQGLQHCAAYLHKLGVFMGKIQHNLHGYLGGGVGQIDLPT